MISFKVFIKSLRDLKSAGACRATTSYTVCLTGLVTVAWLWRERRATVEKRIVTLRDFSVVIQLSR